MRGGVSYIAKRCSKANNKYMTDYVSSEESIFTIYLDANNFYGWAISVPYGRFKWWSQKEIKNFHVNSISENSLDECILEVYLEYSDELHDVHNDYPLASEKLDICNGMLSSYCSKIINKYGIKVGGVNNM